MSIKNTYVMTRPNTGVAWPQPNSGFMERARHYDKLGKRTILSKKEDETGLKQTTISLFDSEKSRFEFGEETAVQDFLNERDIYCINKGITAQQSQETV